MMKRIAALTALVITLLAVPAAAMATTGGPGPGPGYAKPTPVQLVCARIHHFHRVYVVRHHKRIPVRFRIRIACPLRGKPFPRPCLSGVLRFEVGTASTRSVRPKISTERTWSTPIRPRHARLAYR